MPGSWRSVIQDLTRKLRHLRHGRRYHMSLDFFVPWNEWESWPRPRRENVMRVSKVQRHSVLNWSHTTSFCFWFFSRSALLSARLSPIHSRVPFSRNQYCLCRRASIVHTSTTNHSSGIRYHFSWSYALFNLQNTASDKGFRTSTRQHCRSFSEPTERSTHRKFTPQWLLTCHLSAA
jgi:hypothetical protein